MPYLKNPYFSFQEMYHICISGIYDHLTADLLNISLVFTTFFVCGNNYLFVLRLIYNFFIIFVVANTSLEKKSGDSLNITEVIVRSLYSRCSPINRISLLSGFVQNFPPQLSIVFSRITGI